MKVLRLLLVFLVLLTNLCLVKPALADLPNFRKSSDYLEISEKLNQLLAQPNPTPEVSEEIATLKFLQYTIESGTAFGQCVNSTDKVLAIYGHDSEKDAAKNISQLYFLAPRQSTDNSLDCDGFYLPKDSSATFLDSQGKSQNVKGAKAIAILDGTRLVVTEDETSGNLVFNAPFSKLVDAETTPWFIPEVTQTILNSRVANLPSNND